MKTVSFFSFTVLLSLLFSTQNVHANCGLDYCPRLASGATPASHSLSLRVSNTAFDLEPGSGQYQEVLLRYEFLGLSHWVFGGETPFIALTVHAHSDSGTSSTSFGPSNPLLYVSWFDHLSDQGMLYLGLQLELPFGNFDAGMAGQHFMAVPYALFEQSFGSAFGLVGVGYSQAYSIASGSEETPLYVNPHEDQEVQARLGGGRHLFDDRWTLQASVLGRYATVDTLEGSGRVHVTASVSSPYTFHEGFTLMPSVEFPLNTPRRFDWKSGLEIKRLF